MRLFNLFFFEGQHILNRRQSAALRMVQIVPFAILARLLPFLLFFLFGARAMAADIVVVQDAPLKIFEQFRYSFLDQLSAAPSATGPKQILPYESEVVYLYRFCRR